MGTKAKLRFGITLLAFQTLFIVLFGAFVRYDGPAAPPPAARPAAPGPGNGSANATTAADREGEYNMVEMEHQGGSEQNLHSLYPMFQDVHVMIFIGFGFLMTFLKRYGFGSVGFNMLIASFVLEWAILVSGFLHMSAGHYVINIQIENMLTADFAAATVLITFGALLGKTSPLQMIIIAVIEIVIFSINEHVGVKLLKVVDIGGSMFVHTFGAYYGLALSRVLYSPKASGSSSAGSVYHSDVFAMIGTVFLWLYWPSFNSALAAEDAQHSAVLNTYLSLAACCVVTFAISALVNNDGKLDMVHVQNATLAGGVAVGTTADMMIHPVGAVIVGSVAAVLSTLGYKYISPFLESRLKIHDTCGVNNLHGMPGVLAGIAGAIAAAMATPELYGSTLHRQFPELGEGRSALAQGGFQALALAMTLAVAIISGALTGLLMKIDIFDRPKDLLYDDEPWWETPEDFALSIKENGKAGLDEDVNVQLMQQKAQQV